MTMETEMSYGSDYHYLPVYSIESGSGYEVLSDLFQKTTQIVNVFFVGETYADDWVLIDAGMPRSADKIIDAAIDRFNTRRPKGIVLTHGHFDHVGALIELLEFWGDVPVYAHPKEMPFLTGQLPYSKADPSVEGGLVAKMSMFFPIQPINLGDRVQALPEDGTIPIMPGWRWIHTPGHTPGHISLFRDSDRTLIAGDAFVTVKQESLYKVFTQDKEISGPPRYLTPDWEAAWQSVKTLNELDPVVAVTGHGLPMIDDELRKNLNMLAEQFAHIAIPNYGKYVWH